MSRRSFRLWHCAIQQAPAQYHSPAPDSAKRSIGRGTETTEENAGNAQRELVSCAVRHYRLPMITHQTTPEGLLVPETAVDSSTSNGQSHNGPIVGENRTYPAPARRKRCSTVGAYPSCRRPGCSFLKLAVKHLTSKTVR